MPKKLPDARFEATPYSGDGWMLSACEAALGLRQTPAVFTIGNGFIGIRGPGDPADAPRVFLNGVFDVTPISYHEAAHGFPRASDTRYGVADATTLFVECDGVALATVSVELDFRAGLRRERRTGTGVAVTIETLVSMARSTVVATRVVITGARGPVRVWRSVTPPPAGHGEGGGIDDPRVGPTAADVWTDARPFTAGNVHGRTDRLAGSGFVVAAAVRTLDRVVDDGTTVDGFAAYAAGRDGDPATDAIAAIEAAATAGFDTLAAEQRAWLDRFWAAAWLRMPGQPLAEQALRHGLIQLVMAAGRDALTSLPAKGQSGEGYEGHVFWDAETYALPVLIHVAPAIARAMLCWRIGGLDAACANARAMGHAYGALYPWRSIAGRECSAYFPAGSAQYHINADVALALGRYLDATGDFSILAEGGARMLAETARIWLQIGFHDAARGGRFVINCVTGPDEYSALVNNNFYTNLMAAEHLRLAATLGSVDAEEAARMLRAAEAMLLPYDDARGVPAQDDAFFSLEPWPFAATPADAYPLLLHYHPMTLYRHQLAKQADAVLAAALLPEQFDDATRRRMLDVYEAVTVHDSTLSASAFAMLAAQTGDGRRAAHYWRVSTLTDLQDLFGNTRHGLHMAALAGGWNALAFGFAGLRTRGGRLSLAPIFDAAIGPYALRLRFRGRGLEISVDSHGSSLAMSDGDLLELTVHGQPVVLAIGAPVEVPHP